MPVKAIGGGRVAPKGDRFPLQPAQDAIRQDHPRRLLKARELGLPEGRSVNAASSDENMSDKPHLGREQLASTFIARCLRIRRFETKCAELYQAQKIRGFLHLYDGEGGCRGRHHGGAGRSRLGRGHLSRPMDMRWQWGLPMGPLMAEMYGQRSRAARAGAAAPCISSTARGASCGGNAIVGGGLPLAIGIAMADKEAVRPAGLPACFFGEGAAGEGEFHESIEPRPVVGTAGSVSCARTISTPWACRLSWPRPETRDLAQGRRLPHAQGESVAA